MTNAERLAASGSTMLTALGTMRAELEQIQPSLEGQVRSEVDAALANFDTLQSRLTKLVEVATPKEVTSAKDEETKEE